MSGKWENLGKQESGSEGGVVINEDAADKIASALLKAVKSLVKQEESAAESAEKAPDKKPASSSKAKQSGTKPAESKPESKPAESKSSTKPAEPEPELTVIVAYQDKNGKVMVDLPLYKEVTVTPVKVWYNTTTKTVTHVFTKGEINSLTK